MVNITKKEFAYRQDHVAIGPVITRKKVDQAIDDCFHYGFGTLCVNPCDVKYAKRRIQGSNIVLASASGFPRGAMTTRVKIREGLGAIEDGAACIDNVINVSRLKSGDDQYVLDELSQYVAAMREALPDIILKTIIEVPLLTRDEIKRACEIVIASGADYVKMSTGTTFGSTFALGDLQMIKNIVGDRIKIKASGAIMTVENAVGAMMMGADRIGNDMAPLWMEEFDNCMW